MDIKEKTIATIGEMVAADHRKADVFKKFGLDFCCGGKKTIEAACRDKGIDVEALSEALTELDNLPDERKHDFNGMALDVLSDHILNIHHTFVNQALPLIDEFSTKVARVHGNANPEVVRIKQLFQAISDELRMHMQKEEAVLFPYIMEMCKAKQNGETLSPAMFGTVKNPINMMHGEHDTAGNVMSEIRELSNDYTPPEHACNTYRVLYAKLKEFEDDLHQHIHLENNILFPKAISLEEELLK